MAFEKGNKYSVGLTNNGRPPLYENPEDLNIKVNEYFDSIKPRTNDNGDTFYNYTTTGLALFLGFETRQSLYDYRDRQDDFSYIIKRALLVIENKYEEALSISSPTGAIFALKNMGWKDKTEVDSNVDLSVKPVEFIVLNGNRDTSTPT